MTKPGLVVLVLSYVAFVSIGLPDTVLGVAWPSLQAAFSIPPSAMGAVLASGMSGYFLSGLLAGGAVARLGVGGLLTASSALVAAALFGYALAPSWLTFFPFGIVWGLGSGAIDAGLNGYAARHFSVRHLNWLHAFWGIGASIGPVLMTFAIAQGHGYRAGYALLAAALATMAVVFAITRRRWNDPRGPNELPTALPAEPIAVAAPNTETTKPGSLWTALQSPRVWLHILIFFLYTGVESTVGQWCFSLLRERRDLSIEAAGIWNSAYWSSLTAGRILLGALITRTGPDPMLRAATLGTLLGAALFTFTAGPLSHAGLLVLGISLAPVFPTLMARTPARVGDALAHHAIGLQVSAATLGAAVVPSVVGFLVARLGLGVVGFVIVGVAGGLLVAHEVLVGVTGKHGGGRASALSEDRE